jgi:hypothetical protein
MFIALAMLPAALEMVLFRNSVPVPEGDFAGIIVPKV